MGVRAAGPRRFRKLALKYHPDKDASEDAARKFHDVCLVSAGCARSASWAACIASAASDSPLRSGNLTPLTLPRRPSTCSAYRNARAFTTCTAPRA